MVVMMLNITLVIYVPQKDINFLFPFYTSTNL